METGEQSGRPCDRHVSGLALDEPGHQIALRLDERDHLGAEPEPRCRERRLVLHRAVDSEELGVLATDSEHERLAVGDDLVVVVRDPAAEQLDRVDAVRPDPSKDVVDHDVEPP